MAAFRKAGRFPFLIRDLSIGLVSAWTMLHLPHGDQDLVLTVQEIRKSDF